MTRFCVKSFPAKSVSSTKIPQSLHGITFKAAALMVACLVTLSAQAGILTSNNSHGLLQGTTAVNGNNIFLSATIGAEVDWSVFSPGAGFQSFLGDNGLSLTESFSQSNYVYVYQLTNVNSLVFGFLDNGLNQITVGTDLGDQVVGAAPGSLSSAVGDVMPVTEIYVGTPPNQLTSVRWSFDNITAVPSGSQSGLLYFASPSPPEFDNVTIGSLAGSSADSLATQASSVPSGPGVPSPGDPIPEPSTLLISLIGLSFCKIANRR